MYGYQPNKDQKHQHQQLQNMSQNQNYNQHYHPLTIRETDSLAEDSINRPTDTNYFNEDDSVNTATNMQLKKQLQFLTDDTNSQQNQQQQKQYPGINIQDEDYEEQMAPTPHQQFLHMNSGLTGNNTNNGNYDFLIDEEYQQVKTLQGELANAKWLIMGEKISLNLILKDVVGDLINQEGLLLQGKSQSAKSSILAGGMNKYQSIAQTANSSLKTNQLTSLSTTGYQHQQFQHQQNYQKNPKYMTMKELDNQMKQLMAGNTQKIQKLLDKEQMLKVQLQQEQEKSQFIESQLNQRLIRQSANDTIQNDRDKYIDELEAQLEEEIQSLKKQLQSTDANFQKLEEQKREIDELVIKVSQELRIKEMDLRDFNYQMVNDRDYLARQVDLLKKELQEEKDRKQTLEHLEEDLIYKCDQRQQDLDMQKSYIMDLEDKQQVNGEAIEKAQRVIERLNSEIDKSTLIIRQVEQERDQFRAECKDQGKRILELNKQLQNTQSQHQMEQQKVSIQLKQEIDELKEALRQYQQQFDEEKRSLNLNLREANDEKYRLHIDKEKSEIAMSREIALLKQQLEEAIKTRDKKIQSLESEFKEQMEHIEMHNKNREEQAQSQLKYLQKRLQEVSNDYNPRSSSINPQNPNSSNANQPTGKPSFLAIIKQEFDKNVGMPSKLQQFEEFKTKVLGCLQDWEFKAEGLAQLSQKYEKELDEYKKIFISMKSMLREKDILIGNIQKSLRIRDSQRDLYVGTIKKELERQTYLIKGDLIEQFKSTQQTASTVNIENQDQERRFQFFKHEYMQLLEDRDQTNNQNLILKGQVEVLNRDLDIITTNHFSFSDKIRVIINKSQVIRDDSQIITELEEVVDELRLRREENQSLKQTLDSLKQQQEEDKQFMNKQIRTLEDQLYHIQKSNMSKEEELQQTHLLKESKLINDIQRLQSESANLQSQLQTRERQVKKLQEQKNQSQDEITELLQKLEYITLEKQGMEDQCKQTLQLIQQIQQSLDTTQQELENKDKAIQELSGLKDKLDDRNIGLKDQIYQKELELQRERELNLQLQDEKYQAQNLKDAALEKQSVLERENQNIYKDLVIQRQTIQEISQAFEETEREKYELQRTCEQMNDVVAQVQDEIIQSQKAIESLNHALEKMRRKYNKAKELKHQIKALKQNEHHQNELIEAMRRQLNKPKSSVEIQTNDSGIQQIAYLSEESQVLQQRLYNIQRENDQLQESLQRYTLDINRLIDEKRDLEDLVDQQNQSIKQIRLNNQQQQLQQNALNSSSNNINSQVKENYNILNSQSQTKPSENHHQSELYQKILQEKENYIMRLEQEQSDMRRELEVLKEKLIGYEIGNLSMDRSLGGQQHIRSYQPTHAKTSITGYANQTNPLNQIKSTGLRNNNLNQTHNSLHFSNMYNATQGTSNPMGLSSHINGGALGLGMLGSIQNNGQQFSTLQASNINQDNGYKSLNRSNIL
eukprot:403363091